MNEPIAGPPEQHPGWSFKYNPLRPILDDVYQKLDTAQGGDPNGALAYQAHKALVAAEKALQTLLDERFQQGIAEGYTRWEQRLEANPGYVVEQSAKLTAYVEEAIAEELERLFTDGEPIYYSPGGTWATSMKLEDHIKELKGGEHD